MEILNQLETEPLPIEEEERRHARRLFVGLICALILTGLLLGGYFYLRQRHEREMAGAETVAAVKPPPKIEIFVDDATLDGKQTVLGGTIHNISNESFKNVAVELELRKRVGGGLETLAVIPDLTELSPDGKARYGVALLAQDYSSARLLRIVAGENRQEVPFKAIPGAPRPPLPATASKTVIVHRPAPKGEEFINTPKNPERVP